MAEAAPHEVGCVARQRELDDALAVAGARHRGERVVGVGSAADERGVADAPRQLHHHPAGGGGGGEVAAGVRATADDRAVRARARSAERLEARPLRRGDEEGVVVGREAHLAGEGRGARSGEQHVGRPLHDPARSATGSFTSFTTATAPQRRVSPSMIEASSSTSPAAVRQAPVPEL